MWESGNVGIWKSRNPEISGNQVMRNLEIWKTGNQEIRKSGNQDTKKSGNQEIIKTREMKSKRGAGRGVGKNMGKARRETRGEDSIVFTCL